VRAALCSWVGDGTAVDPFRPDLPADVAFGLIDLRADVTIPVGWCLVVSDRTDPIPVADTSIELGVTSPDDPVDADVLPLLDLDVDQVWTFADVVRAVMEPILPPGGHDVWCGGILVASWG
jgi:hypothetical protein